jgi:hypothetical protein
MRAQAHALEGVMAALIILLALFFALQAVAVTPLTASLAQQHVADQGQAAATGTLTAARETGDLRPTLLYWNESTTTFHGTPGRGFYVGSGPPTAFGGMLDETFDPRRLVFNVNLVYLDSAGNRQRRPLVRSGEPPADVVVATRTVTLYDHDRLRDASGAPTNTHLENGSYFAPDVGPGEVYNVVEIEVVIWQG